MAFAPVAMKVCSSGGRDTDDVPALDATAPGAETVRGLTISGGPDQMSLYIALGVGGVLGVYGRYGLTQLLHNVLGDGFPIGTLVVNVLGTFVLAFLFVFTLERLAVSPALRAGMMTGGLGAFTTFSTFVVEALMLVEDGEVGKAALYLTLSIGLGMAAAFAGLYLGRNL